MELPSAASSSGIGLPAPSSPVVDHLNAPPGHDDDADEEEEVTTETAGHELFDYLVELNQVGKLSAKDACPIAFWAVNAGAEGPCKQLGKAPGDKNTGN